MLYIQKKTVGVVSICMGIFNAEPAAVCARLAVTTVAMHVHSYSNGSGCTQFSPLGSTLTMLCCFFSA